MFSIGHMIVIFLVVLVVFGPQKLPELARGLGKLMAEFRKASFDFKTAFEEEMRDLERQARETERKKAAAALTQANQPATLATPAGAETPVIAPPGDTRATEAPMIVPSAESIPRLPPIEPSETLSAEVPAEAESEKASSADVAHDHQQPA